MPSLWETSRKCMSIMCILRALDFIDLEENVEDTEISRIVFLNMYIRPLWLLNLLFFSDGS